MRSAAGSNTHLALALALLALAASACKSSDVAEPPATAPSRAAQPGPSPIEQMDRFIAYRPIDKQNPDWKLDIPRPPSVRFPRDLKLYWVLDTSAGVLKIELKPEYAPRHVSTAIYLSRIGFYDDTLFHRIVPKFMAQGGDPLGTGTGGPGFSYSGEFPKRPRTHDERGVVSAANSGPHTDGSQFFILFDEAAHLDGKHSIYGQVVEGWGTLGALERAGSQSGKPTAKIWIRRATIVEE